MLRIKFKDFDDKKIYEIHCKNEDLNLNHHPYFAYVRKITQPTHSPILQIDNKEIQRFKNTKSMMIPAQSIILIEEIEDEKSRLTKIKSFPESKTKSNLPPNSMLKNPWIENPSS